MNGIEIYIGFVIDAIVQGCAINYCITIYCNKYVANGSTQFNKHA